MATAQTIINRSLRLLRQIAAGVSPTADETADALVALNAMLDSWRNERLMVYSIQDETLNLVSNQRTYTIGPAGNLNTVRPVRIEAAYIVSNNQSYDVRIVNEEEYAALPSKLTTSTWPDRVYYQPSMATGTLYCYPVPSQVSALHLLTWTTFTAFATAGDTVTLPPGFEDALAFNLAIRISSEYEGQPDGCVIQLARETKDAIKNINSRALRMYTELPLLVGSYRSNIITDQP